MIAFIKHVLTRHWLNMITLKIHRSLEAEHIFSVMRPRLARVLRGFEHERTTWPTPGFRTRWAWLSRIGGHLQ